MNQKKYWAKAVALALCGALLLSGCSGGGGSESDKSTKKTDASSSSSSDGSGEATKDYSKYNAYLRVIDIINDDIEPALSAYFDNVDYGEEFAVTGDYGAIKEGVRFFTANTYTVEEAMEYAKEDPAYPKADAAITAMGGSMIQVMEALEDLASYMSFDDYEEDNLAKAPEIHAQLWQALQVYDTYYMNFLNAIDEMANATRDDDRAELLEDGEMVLYHSLTMIHASEDILDVIWTQIEAANAEAGPEDEMVLPEIDMTELTPLFDQVQSTYEELNGDLANEEERSKISSFTGVIGDSALKLYNNKVESLLSWVNKLKTDLTEGGDYAEDFNKVNEAISSMIDGYNSII